MAEAILLDRLLGSYGPRRRAHAGWVALAAWGALGIAWELPSPDLAWPGLWALGLAISVVVGSARFGGALVLPTAALAAGLLALVGVTWWAVGGWPLVGAAAIALVAGRIGGGPDVWTTGPIWWAASLTGNGFRFAESLTTPVRTVGPGPAP